MSEAFGFTVRRFTETDDDDFNPVPLETPLWSVTLPHQCDTWDIAGEGALDRHVDDAVPHSEAVAELERFVAEAQEALTALREGREFGYVGD